MFMGNNPTLDSLKAHLNSLSKNDIIELVFKYVPADHLRSINNTRLEKNEALLIYDKIKDEIILWFDDIEFIREPYGLENGFAFQLQKLRGMELQILPQLAEFILLMINKVESAFYSGFLDDYIEDYSFQFPEEFENLLSIVFENLPRQQNIDFQIQLNQLLSKCEHSTFNSLMDLIKKHLLIS